MKTIYLAAYTQTENHGPGKKIAIAYSKPDDLQVAGVFEPFIPKESISLEYKERQLNSQSEASEHFVAAYTEQLQEFFDKVAKDGKATEVLPFEDGDTLLTWERHGRRSIRPVLAEVLKKAGYEVVLR